MGRGIVESGLFRSERYQLERRTSDPATTQEGEMWIRTDLAPDADQLATLRFDAGGSTWDVPIYNVGATTENVEKVWRVSIGGTTGFVPLTDDSPTFEALKYQHNGAAFSAHDALTAFATPDSDVTQAQRYWPADDGSGSTIAEDRLGDDSTGFTGSWTSGSYIGGMAPVYDGANDWDEADYAFDATFQGFGFFVAIEPHSGGMGTERYFADPSGGSGGNGWEPGPAGRVGADDGLEFFTKNGTSTVTLQSSAISHDTLHTVGASYNPNNEAVLYLDGSRVDSASVGTPENNEPTTMNWGSSRTNDRTFDGVIDARLHLQGDYWTDSEHQEIHDQYMALI